MLKMTRTLMNTFLGELDLYRICKWLRLMVHDVRILKHLSWICSPSKTKCLCSPSIYLHEMLQVHEILSVACFWGYIGMRMRNYPSQDAKNVENDGYFAGIPKATMSSWCFTTSET